ncbi:DSBA-like thioredoxin domain-containing protein [Seiridium cupressi]
MNDLHACKRDFYAYTNVDGFGVAPCTLENSATDLGVGNWRRSRTADQPSFLPRLESLRGFTFMLALDADVLKGYWIYLYKEFRYRNSNMTHFNIKVISDPVCPFCYLGKTRLDKGIELCTYILESHTALLALFTEHRKVYPGGKDDTFNISWVAFYLDPGAPQVGIPLLERMEQRFGREKVSMILEGLRKQGLENGVNFSTKSKIGNTRNAHRLIQLAKTKDNETENQVIMELFKAYFEDGGDITSFETLIGAAVKAGLDENETEGWLESGKGGEAVDREVDEAYTKGLNGVPQFTFRRSGR